MKTLNKIIVAFIILFTFNACNYLDIVPDNVATIDYAFRNRTVAERYLYSCYSYRPEIGSVDNDPAMNGGNETWQRYSTNWWPTYANSNLQRGDQIVSDPVLNFWDGSRAGKPLWRGIRDCNIFLENIDKVTDLTDYEKKRWVAEINFLKAYYHFYLMKCYGPIPIVDKNLPISAGPSEVQVYREPIDKVVTYIVDLLKVAQTDLPNAEDILEGTEAGRVDKLAAATLRAEVLLFAASPLFNCNTDYANWKDNKGVVLFPQDKTVETKKWADAAIACKEAIDLCQAQNKGLYDLIDPNTLPAAPEFQLQTTYRQAICDPWNKELIWGGTSNNVGHLAQQSQVRLVRMPERLNDALSEWCPTLKTVEMYYSANGVPINEDKDWNAGADSSWYANRFSIRPEPSASVNDAEKFFIRKGEKTVYLHYNREPRFYASVGFDKGIYFGNGYYNFPANVKFCDFLNFGVSGYQGGSGYSASGYSIKKMHSFKNAQSAAATSWEYFPFPIYRLANLYLMYAESLNEAEPTGERNDSIFQYLDLIRARAGLKGVKESWTNYSNNPDKFTTLSGLREIIRQERGIELAFEGKRFWDVRRWKKLDEMNVQPQGWNILGEVPDDFYKVMPMAHKALNFTIKDYFWPIKESDITVNRNLLQTYGW